MRPLCPIQKDFTEVQFSARLLAEKMARLRRQMHRCAQCQGPDCPVLKDFRHAARLALQEVTAELNLIELVKRNPQSPHRSP